ncbi:MAG: hypothetical protein M1814_005190 [Vezdaea aestivalis]|nr:MAG: hypothetical protein M1814_005190 [Vezdaea aestivalis]
MVSESTYISPVWRDGIFNGKVVFCTGGSGSICSAQVRALVRLGANACIVGRNKEKTERVAVDIALCREDAKVIGVGEVDVRNPLSLNSAVDRCVEELGGLDYCIAGAAGNFLAPIDQLSSNAFKAVMDIDVLGSYNTAKAVMPSLIKSAEQSELASSGTGGRIIFISATLHYTGTPLQAHVSSAKAAVDALSASLAIEYGPRGVTSNVIAPGPIAGTEGMERLARANDVDSYARSIPLGRWGSVRDIADAGVYLFGPAGRYCNGSVLVVDGGSWRTYTQPGSALAYPDFLLSGAKVTGVKGEKQSKL